MGGLRPEHRIADPRSEKLFIDAALESVIFDVTEETEETEEIEASGDAAEVLEEVPDG